MNYIKSALDKATDTKGLKIGIGAGSSVGSMFKSLFGDAAAVIIADSNTFIVAGKEIDSVLRSEGIEVKTPYIFQDNDLYAEWKYLLEVENYIKSIDAIPIAVGSGVINDLVKLASDHLGRRYMTVGTAASMDGYTAFGASISFEGNKQSFNCRAPKGIILDPVISAEAPKELAASGYADLIAKIPAAADWMIADAIGVEAIDDFAFDLVQSKLRASLSNPQAIASGDVEATAGLAEGLIMSGFAMQTIQSSRPASGTEHQYSHFWDMENLCLNGKHVSHGFKVGIGTLVSTASLEFLINYDFSNLDMDHCIENWKSWEETEAEIKELFKDNEGLLTRALIETKAKYIDKEALRSQITIFIEKWPTLKEIIRNQIMPFDQVKESLKAVGAPYEPEMIGISRERLMKTFKRIPYMRSRFTNADIFFRLDIMKELEENLFGKEGKWKI